MQGLKVFLRQVLSLPKSVWFNFRCLPFRTAVKLPFLISYDTKLMELHRGIICLDCEPKRFMIKFGIGGTLKIDSQKAKIFLEKGEIHFKGKAVFSRGNVLANRGCLTIGDHFFANTSCTVWCLNRMTIGEDCLLGWGVMMRDSDGHEVEGIEEKEVTIGDHCWLCSESVILKNSAMGDGSILGYRGVLTKPHKNKNVLLAGMPAVIKKEGVHWEH